MEGAGSYGSPSPYLPVCLACVLVGQPRAHTDGTPIHLCVLCLMALQVARYHLCISITYAPEGLGKHLGSPVAVGVHVSGAQRLAHLSPWALQTLGASAFQEMSACLGNSKIDSRKGRGGRASWGDWHLPRKMQTSTPSSFLVGSPNMWPPMCKTKMCSCLSQNTTG